MLLSPCRRITLGRLRMVGLSSLLMRLEGEIKNYQGRGSACVKHDMCRVRDEPIAHRQERMGIAEHDSIACCALRLRS